MHLMSLLLLAQSFPLQTTDSLVPHKTKITPVVYRDLKSIRVTGDGDQNLVVISGAEFSNGSIEVEMAGAPGAGASATARGFVGVAFRVTGDASRFEAFYLRPTNGRAEDQVRRNHSAQYISTPEFPWERLRKEFPEKYESYVDLEPGAWTKVRIEVDGVKARLFVHGNSQPTLIVNDLRMGQAKGAVALWLGPGTEAHFRNLKITRRD
jgi:hypothetical protein